MAVRGGAARISLPYKAHNHVHTQFESLPDHIQEYLEGSANELYEAALPDHLAGLPFETVRRAASHMPLSAAACRAVAPLVS